MNHCNRGGVVGELKDSAYRDHSSLSLSLSFSLPLSLSPPTLSLSISPPLSLSPSLPPFVFFSCSLSFFPSLSVSPPLYVSQDGQSRTVRQFQFTDWPEQGVPKSGAGFIDFIEQR